MLKNSFIVPICNSRRSKLKEISLETMDGYEFQKFVANLFKQLGFTNIKVGPPTADGGIDIFMEQRTDVGSIKYTVECKHHPENAIGRPVIQKLHSAVMHTPILDKGIVVTSGHFSSQAIKYAEEVGIELMGIEKLKELAKKAGLSLRLKPSLSIENCFPISEKSKLINKLFSFLRNDLRGFDKDSANVEEIGLRLLSSYLVDFSINATFSTSVGVIHSIYEKSSLFLMGDSGEPINPIVTDPLLSKRYNISEMNEEDIKEFKLIEKGEFVKTHKEIKASAVRALRKMYTRTVSYYGANNRHYTKSCIPKKKHITLVEVTRVYIPVWSIVFSILKNKYIVVGTENPEELNILPSKFITLKETSDIKAYPDYCMICSKEMKQEKYICNDCGMIVCDRDSSSCKICEKVICKEHTISKRKFLVLSDKYCSSCAKIEGI